jgi:hypothetical protein
MFLNTLQKSKGRLPKSLKSRFKPNESVMEQMNFHKQKLYALIAAGLGIIAMFLPWWRVSLGGFGSVSANGMRDLGILAFVGFLGAGIMTFMGDKQKPFEGQNRMIVAACFAVAAVVALIQFLRATSAASFGIWLSIIAGVAGAYVVYLMKPERFENKQV